MEREVKLMLWKKYWCWFLSNTGGAAGSYQTSLAARFNHPIAGLAASKIWLFALNIETVRTNTKQISTAINHSHTFLIHCAVWALSRLTKFTWFLLLKDSICSSCNVLKCGKWVQEACFDQNGVLNNGNRGVERVNEMPHKYENCAEFGTRTACLLVREDIDTARTQSVIAIAIADEIQGIQRIA